jgi:uncharacterized protein YjaG (DUF416 family)
MKHVDEFDLHAAYGAAAADCAAATAELQRVRMAGTRTEYARAVEAVARSTSKREETESALLSHRRARQV